MAWSDGREPKLNSTPLLLGSWPEIMAARAGTQSGQAVMALAMATPVRASRSRLGVRTIGSPAYPCSR